MDDEKEIRKFVRLQMQEGRDLPGIFNDFCLEFCGKSSELSAKEILQWLRILRHDIDKCFSSLIFYNRILSKCPVFEGPPALKFRPMKERGAVDQIPSLEYYPPLKILADQYGKAQRAYEARKCAGNKSVFDCKLILLSERYAVDAESHLNGLPDFYLIDILYNEKRKLKINGDHSSIKSIFKLDVLDSTHFLCHYPCDELKDRSKRKYYIEVYLFEVNVARMECAVKERYELNDYILTILVNSTDPRQLCSHVGGYSNYARKGRLNDDGKLELDGEKLDLTIRIPGKKVDVYNDSYCFAGDKFYGACRNQEGEREFFLFEAIFVRGKVRLLQLVNFGTGSKFESGGRAFVWSGKTCYLIMCSNEHKGFLYKFDLNTREMTEIDNIPVSDRICRASLNNGILAICTVSGELQHVWHRIALSSPDTLLNSSMQRLQQEALFMNGKEYRNLLRKLPPNLRPFGNSLEVESCGDLEQQEPESSKRARLLSDVNCNMKRSK